MKINGNEIRPGNVIEHKGTLWVAVKTQAVKPGKGPAYAQVELKNPIDGTKLNERFRSSETVERVRLEQKDYQFLFAEGDMLIFMDNETYEQIEIRSDFLDDRAAFLQDGMMVTVESHEGKPARRLAARSGDAGRGRGRAGGEGPDRRVVLQAGHARERRARDGAALRRRRASGSLSIPTSSPMFAAPTSDVAAAFRHVANVMAGLSRPSTSDAKQNRGCPAQGRA